MSLRLVQGRPPVPPADLRMRVVESFTTEIIEDVRLAFDVDALEHLGYFERALASVGRAFEDFDRLLDFGCGCGRISVLAAQLRDEINQARTGTDTD
jgi:predicted TPR repeat methyltransferase